ncbi:uncharacterized protein [Manis javanica]|uniref:uncharacterized protein isoform X2 n=1 Tax=Manis javanica TaxID=9974 RepID=UPI003C6D1D60
MAVVSMGRPGREKEGRRTVDAAAEGAGLRAGEEGREEGRRTVDAAAEGAGLRAGEEGREKATRPVGGAAGSAVLPRRRWRRGRQGGRGERRRSGRTVGGADEVPEP